MPEPFARTEMLLGKDAMQALERARVIVFGIGGVGGAAAEALARCGIGAIDLVDHDVISETNLNRQIAATVPVVGQPKAQVMATRIRDINPNCVVTVHPFIYLPDTADRIDLTAYDYVVDAIGLRGCRYLQNLGLPARKDHSQGMPQARNQGPQGGVFARRRARPPPGRRRPGASRRTPQHSGVGLVRPTRRWLHLGRRGRERPHQAGVTHHTGRPVATTAPVRTTLPANRPSSAGSLQQARRRWFRQPPPPRSNRRPSRTRIRNTAPEPTRRGRAEYRASAPDMLLAR